MRILIYGINYAPELTGAGKYTSEMAEWLAEQQHEVRVITAPPYYPSWQIEKGYQPWVYTREWLHGVEVFRCPIWVTERPNGIQRLVHLASFALSSLAVLIQHLFWRPDVILVVEPAFFCVPAALVMARLTGARSWLHIQDFEVDAAFALKALPSIDWLKRLAGEIERWLMQRFDRVSSISTQMVDRCIDKGVPSERTVLLPNWVDCERIYPLSRPSSLRTRLGFSKADTVVLYSGNMGAKQGLDLLLDAAQLVPDFQFVLCGEGSARARLQERVKAQRLSNVHFLPLQPFAQLNDLLNMADIHALVQRDAPADLVMPSKLVGMLASGRPILATARPDTAIAAVMSASNCGQLVAPEAPTAFATALRSMVAHPAMLRKYGQNGRQYATTNLTVGAILSSLETKFEQLGLDESQLQADVRNSRLGARKPLVH